jgi:hypothetical protein
MQADHKDNFVSTAEQGDQAFDRWQSGRPWHFVITDCLFVPGAMFH